MMGGIDYSHLHCNHHERDANPCDCVDVSVNMVMCPDDYPHAKHFVACMEACFEHEGVQLRSMYSDVITHDRLLLSGENPNDPFAYCVRPNGTHLIRLSDRDGVGHRCWEYPGFVGNSFAGQPTCWWWWDGQKMNPLSSYMDAQKLLREECERRGITYR